MDVELISENADGSADYNVKMSHEEQAQLFRFAFIEILKRGIEEGKQYECSETGMGNTYWGGLSSSDGKGKQPIESKQSRNSSKAS